MDTQSDKENTVFFLFFCFFLLFFFNIFTIQNFIYLKFSKQSHGFYLPELQKEPGHLKQA